FTADGERACIEVRDRGIGIAAADQRQIFERFERAVSSRNYGGLGLGLYIVRRIVEAHGGTIRVESEPGEGAAFFVDLPLRAAPRPPAPEDRVEH
ncbi:MAG TPA: ATP-binding protein, partial [Anaeromyxobacteraceae bacterium]|nr:ATP-binding protein [Anaeromyxobacteraceae bacterium]